MIASAFSAGTSGGTPVEEYLIEEEGREVAPELFKGDIGLTRDLIDTNHRRWKYTSGVLAFHEDDRPTVKQLEEIVEDFEAFMFAGKSPDTFQITWVLHRDKGNAELHFVVPRIDLETGQDLNIAPPGHEKDWAPWVASINHRYGFVDPMAQPVKLTKDMRLEAPDRKATREQLNAWVEAQVDSDQIKDRDHLVRILGRVGEVTRVNNKFISVKPKGADKALRLKGALYEHGFDFWAGRNHSRSPDTHQNDPDLQPVQYRKHAEEIQRCRDEAFTRRRVFFEKLRARSRKLQREALYDQERQNDHTGAITEAAADYKVAGKKDISDWLIDAPLDESNAYPPTPSVAHVERLIKNRRSQVDRQTDREGHNAHAGPFAATLDRLGNRERELTEISQRTRRAVRSHGRLLERIVQLAAGAGRALERIGRLMHSVIKALKQVTPKPRKNPGPPGTGM